MFFDEPGEFVGAGDGGVHVRGNLEKEERRKLQGGCLETHVQTHV